MVGCYGRNKEVECPHPHSTFITTSHSNCNIKGKNMQKFPCSVGVCVVYVCAHV